MFSVMLFDSPMPPMGNEIRFTIDEAKYQTYSQRNVFDIA